ncbi:hypothetical protein SAMN05444162_3706 [Paenibacillaceae bacterium GAS479]|nr:hypothetical protein SAMN05444162_3706 [Paenibacillaceae bacterium GAS479]
MSFLPILGWRCCDSILMYGEASPFLRTAGGVTYVRYTGKNKTRAEHVPYGMHGKSN